MGNLKSRLGAIVRRESTVSSVLTAAVVAVVLVANVLLYILGSYFGVYLYYPERDDLELSGATDKLFESDKDSG